MVSNVHRKVVNLLLFDNEEVETTYIVLTIQYKEEMCKIHLLIETVLLRETAQSRIKKIVQIGSELLKQILDSPIMDDEEK